MPKPKLKKADTLKIELQGNMILIADPSGAEDLILCKRIAGITVRPDTNPKDRWDLDIYVMGGIMSWCNITKDPAFKCRDLILILVAEYVNTLNE